MYKLKSEIIKEIMTTAVAHEIQNCVIEDVETDDRAINLKAVKILAEIQKVIQDDDLNDFDAIEKIACIFEDNKIDACPRHDFG